MSSKICNDTCENKKRYCLQACIFRVDEKGGFIPRRESKREKMFPITTIRGNKWSKQDRQSDRLTGSMTEKRGIEGLLCWGWMKGVNKR